MNTRRIVKISIITLISLVLLFIVGVIGLITFVNPNTFKPMISKNVYESTGRKLAIDGDISWKLWPNIGLKIEKLSLSNPEGFTPANMLDVSSATVSVQLMPLLHNNLIINNITVDGLNVGLIKKGNMNNWTFTPISKAAEGKEGAPSKQMQLELSKLLISNSTFSYTDTNKNTNYKIENFSFNVEADRTGKISLDPDAQKIELDKVKFDFSKIINGKLNFTANNFNNLAYQGSVDVNNFSVPKLASKLGKPITALEGNDLFSQVAFKGTFKGDLNSLVFNGFEFNLSDVVKGLMNVKVNNLSNPNYSGDIDIDQFSANKALDKMNIAVNDRKNNVLLNKVALNTKFSGDTNSVNLQQLKFDFPGTLSGVANVKLQDFSKPTYNGNINLPTFSLNQVIAKSGMTPIDIPNKQLLDKVSVQSNLSGSTNSINLTQLVGKVSDSTVSGNINITSIKPFSMNENIHLDKIELSDITDANGYKVPLTGINASGSLANTNSDFKNMSGVSAIQNISIDNITVLGFDLNNLITQFDNALTSTGKTVTLENLQPISNSSQVIQSVRNMQDIAAKAKAKGQKDYSQKTNFGTMQSNLVMHNGIADPSSFKLSGPTIKADGKGRVNMVDKSLNYLISSQIVAKQRNEILNKITFPYTAKGKFDNVQGSADWVSIQGQMLQYVVGRAADQTKAIVKNQVGKNINNIKIGASSPAVDNVKKGATNLINNIFR